MEFVLHRDWVVIEFGLLVFLVFCWSLRWYSRGLRSLGRIRIVWLLGAHKRLSISLLLRNIVARVSRPESGRFEKLFRLSLGEIWGLHAATLGVIRVASHGLSEAIILIRRLDTLELIDSLHLPDYSIFAALGVFLKAWFEIFYDLIIIYI